MFWVLKCIDCNKNYKLHFDRDLINRFPNTYEFCNKDTDSFILLLKQGIYLNRLAGYYDLYIQSDTLLLGDAFETNVLKYMNLIRLIFYLHPD